MCVKGYPDEEYEYCKNDRRFDFSNQCRLVKLFIDVTLRQAQADS
jgi:hypothetical protein